VTKFCIFLTPPVPFQLSRSKEAKYRHSKKNGSPRKVSIHLCQFRRSSAYKLLRSRRRFPFFFKLRFLAYISGDAEHTFAKLLPVVDLGCVQIHQYFGSCDVFPTLHGGPKNVEILHIFGPSYSLARTRQNIVILKRTC